MKREYWIAQVNGFSNYYIVWSAFPGDLPSREYEGTEEECERWIRKNT